MMHSIEAAVVVEEPRFKSDFDKIKKGAGTKLGKRLNDDYEALVKIMESGQRIPDQYKEHPLKGKHAGKWEVHLLGRTSDYLVWFTKYTNENGQLVYNIERFTKHKALQRARIEANLRACLELADYLDDEDLDYILKLCDKYGVEVD